MSYLLILVSLSALGLVQSVSQQTDIFTEWIESAAPEAAPLSSSSIIMERLGSSTSLGTRLRNMFQTVHQMAVTSLRNPNLSPELASLLQQVVELDNSDLQEQFHADLQTIVKFQTPTSALAIAHYVHHVLDLAIRLCSLPGKLARRNSFIMVSYTMTIVHKTPVGVRNAIVDGATFLHQLLSYRFVLAQGILEGIQDLIPSMDPDILSVRDSLGETPLTLAIRAIPEILDVIKSLINHMSCEGLVYSWARSLSSQSLPIWSHLFSDFNTKFLHLSQYDLKGLARDLQISDMSLFWRLTRSLYIRSLWAHQESTRSLVMYVAVFFSDDAELLAQYNATNADELLRRLFPDIETNTCRADFLRKSLSYLRRPSDERIEEVIQLFSRSCHESDRTPFIVALNELSTRSGSDISPKFLQMAQDLVFCHLGRYALALTVPALTPHRGFIMQAVSRFVSKPTAFMGLRPTHQLAHIICMAAHSPDLPRSRNLVIIAARLIMELCLTDVELALPPLCMLMSSPVAFQTFTCAQHTADAIHTALNQFGFEPKFQCLIAHMLVVLLNNRAVVDGAVKEDEIAIHHAAGRFTSLIKLLISRVPISRLADVFMSCPPSPILRNTFPFHVASFVSDLLRRQINQVFCSIPNDCFRYPTLGEFSQDRYQTCAICLEENTVEEILPEAQQPPSKKLKLNKSVTIINCLHCFHSSCLQMGLSKSQLCPTCRSRIPLDMIRHPLYKSDLSLLDLAALLSAHPPNPSAT